MRDGGVVIYDQLDGSCVPWLHDIPFRVVRLILLWRMKEQRVIVVAPKCLLVKPPLEVTCAVHNLINDDVESLRGFGIGFHGIVWGR